MFEVLENRLVFSGTDANTDSINAFIVDNGTGYKISITVDRTDTIEVGPTAEQFVPIELTDANGDAIPGLPSNFTLRIAPGAPSATGFIPLPNGIPQYVDAIARIERADQQEFEVVEFSGSSDSSDSSKKKERFETPAGPTLEDLPNGTSVVYEDGTNTTGGQGHITIIIKQYGGALVFSFEKGGWKIYNYGEYRYWIDEGDVIIPLKPRTGTTITINDAITYVTDPTNNGEYLVTANNCSLSGVRLLIHLGIQLPFDGDLPVDVRNGLIGDNANPADPVRNGPQIDIVR